MISPQVILILGAGPGIGAQTVSKFLAKGYRVALAARSLQDSLVEESKLELHVDLAQPDTLPGLFAKVKEKLGTPSVVLYNGASLTMLPAEDPLSGLSTGQYGKDMAVNVTSAFVAVQQAVLGFKELPPSTSKTFIYTGNKLNVMSDPKVLAFGMAKSAMAHMIWDCSIAYRSQGFKFYFTDERLADGTPSRQLMDPKARAELHWELAQDEKQRAWHYTYIKEKGWVDFRGLDMPWEV